MLQGPACTGEYAALLADLSRHAVASRWSKKSVRAGPHTSAGC